MNARLPCKVAEHWHLEDEIIAQAELIEVFPQVEVPVATPAHLTALKLLSASLERMKDLSDLSALREIMSESERLNAQEACRLITKRGYNRGLDLESRFERWSRGQLPIS